MRLLRIPGVYGPHRDSELLAEAIPAFVEPGDRVLDPFTGSGVLALTAAQAGAGEVRAVDVGRRAVIATAINARLNGLEVNVSRGSLFEPVAGSRFDLIVANPPYVPDFNGDARVTGPARAWEAGPDGRRFIDLLIAGATAHLRPGGRLLIVHSSLCGIARTVALLQEQGMDADVVSSERAPLGPITAPRAEELERRGMLDPGDRTEATVVIRGLLRAPALVPEPELALSAS